ncbi:MAG: alpha/beta hydrolase [Capnocytophaga sp.]|nr:alpha/beta hydrolase [Capnocytophaga sp.]
MNHEKPFFYQKTGKGSVLLFLHGFLEDASIWNAYAEELSDQYTILMPDFPGHGKTPSVADIHTMEYMAEGIRKILAKENITQCAVIGHSMGGYVALALAELYPQYLSGIMLMNSTSIADTDEKKANRDRVSEIVFKEKETFVRTAIPSLFAVENREKYAKEIKILTQKALQMQTQGISAAAQGMKIRPERTAILQNFPKEKHYIIGRSDALIPEEETVLQAQKVGASYTITKGGHMAYIENYSETLSCIHSFAKRCFDI